MAISVVRLGSSRAPHEGLRIGTVRRPPRGVPKRDFAKRNYYDVWLPELSPSSRLVTVALRAKDDSSWKAFERQFLREMRTHEATRLLGLLAALSHQTNFSIGCYCEDERRCHRSILKKLLGEQKAAFV